MKLSLAENKTSFDIIDSSGAAGWFGLNFYLAAGGKRRGLAGIKRRSSSGTTILEGGINENLDVTLKIRPAEKCEGLIITPILKNKSKRALKFSGYGYERAHDSKGHVVPGNANFAEVYAHTDNLRLEELPFCKVEYPFIRPLHHSKLRLSLQCSGTIPALFLGRVNQEHWMMEAAYTQERHGLRWELGLDKNGKHHLHCSSEFSWTGGHDEIIPAQSEIKLESIFFAFVKARPDELYKSYIDELTFVYDFAGAASRLGSTPVFCTWNFGIFTNVNEKDCLKRMEIVSRTMPGAYFQIDHGYQVPNKPGEQPSPDIDAYYPDGVNVWDKKKFPSGPEGFVQASKKRKLIPGIWISPRVCPDGIIQKKHPEWILLDKSGKPVNVGHLMLDCSVKEVRDFLENTFRRIFKTWGFRGIKLDFFSYMFDHDNLRFRNGGTGIQWKKWLFSMIRSLSGPDAYFLYCISCPLGNPFLAIDGPDSYRAGIDIDIGHWDHHFRGSSWLLPGMLANSGGKTWFGNIDSCMGAPSVPANERRFRLAFAYVTGGMLEFSGPVEKLGREAICDMKYLASRCERSGKILCPDNSAFYGQALPSVLVRHKKTGSGKKGSPLMTVALFNWNDAPRVISISFEELGLKLKKKHLFLDFWTGRKHSFNGTISSTIPARSHLIYDVYL